jgi:hypothetical protein
VPDRPDNSALLREVNERILEVSTSWVGPAAAVGFLCECGDADCVSVVILPAAGYEAIRATSGGLVLHRGHTPEVAEDVAA